MPNDDRQWGCLTCGHTEMQPAHVIAVQHPCPYRGGRLVELAGGNAACTYCTHSYGAHMHNNPRRLCRLCMCTGYATEPQR